MNSASAIDEALRALRALEGLHSCAVVEPDSGLVLAHQGDAPEPMWEAAVDYWRMHERLEGYFASLGPLGVAVMYHTRGVLAVLPCDASPRLLVTCFGEHRTTDWRGVQRQVRRLSDQLNHRPRA